MRFQRALAPRYTAVREQVGMLNHQLANNLSGIATIKSFTAEAHEVGRIGRESDEYRQRNVYAIKLSDNVTADENEAEVLFLGCHHAREWIAVDVPLKIAQHLAANYAGDPQIRSLLDRSEVWILPVVNPDGLEYSIHVYRYWRKNRRDNGNGSFGVDLNHRFTPAARLAKRWVEEGRIGHQLFVNMAMWIKNPAESSPCSRNGSSALCSI